MRPSTSAPEPIVLDLPGATAAFSTRCGGVSEGPYESLNLGILTDDDPVRVAENRHRLAVAVDLDPRRVAMGWQVHGAEVKEWAGAPEGAAYAAPGGALAEVDAHTTRESKLGLLVLAADCLPIALASPERVAMVHAGWRGLAGGVLETTLAHFESPAAAVIGPGIGPCCYTVGREVLAAFAELEGVTTGGRLDLRAVARRRLAASGVDRIEEVELCTSCRDDLFFSHRRDGGLTGRQGGMVWRG